MSAKLSPKELICDCGYRFVSEQHSNWCNKCGKQVFYDPRDRIKGKISNVYITVLLVLVIGFLAYFFIEMILTPALTNLQ